MDKKFRMYLFLAHFLKGAYTVMTTSPLLIYIYYVGMFSLGIEVKLSVVMEGHQFVL